MLARSAAIALLLILCLGAAGWAAEPHGGTIVLQLPPSMSAEAAKELIANLADKGVRPGAELSEPPPAPSPPWLTTASLATQVWARTKQALQAIPTLRQAPQAWTRWVEVEGDKPGSTYGFWVVALAGLIAAPLIGRVFRAFADRHQVRVTEPGLAPRLRVTVIRLLAASASLGLFGVLFWLALLCVSSGRPILEETADHLVWAALKWRLSIIALLIVVSPFRPDIRLLAIDDADARACSRWMRFTWRSTR